MTYFTQQMVADVDMTYFGQDLREGDQFVATDNDAEYLARCRRARYVTKVEVAAPPAAPAPAPAAPARRGRAAAAPAPAPEPTPAPAPAADLLMTTSTGALTGGSTETA